MMTGETIDVREGGGEEADSTIGQGGETGMMIGRRGSKEDKKGSLLVRVLKAENYECLVCTQT